jgi:hypothetical protein
MWWTVVQIGLVLAAVWFVVWFVWILIQRVQDLIYEFKRRMKWTATDLYQMRPAPPDAPSSLPSSAAAYVTYPKAAYPVPLPAPAAPTDDGPPSSTTVDERRAQDAAAEAQRNNEALYLTQGQTDPNRDGVPNNLQDFDRDGVMGE